MLRENPNSLQRHVQRVESFMANIRHQEDKTGSLTLALNLMSEKLELLIKQQKSDREQLEYRMENLQRELKGIKNRQEMIFQKQDQIQSTLHGETLPIQSPPASVISFSPPFMHSAPSSVTGCRMVSQPPPPPHEQLGFDTTDVVSMLTDSDVTSLLSYDWAALDQAEQLKATAPTEMFGVGIQTPRHSIYDYEDAATGLYEAATQKCGPTTGTQTSTAGTPNRASFTAGNIMDRPVNRDSLATGNVGDINREPSTTGSNRIGDGSTAAAGNQTAHVTGSLKHPSDVLLANREYEQKDIGKLGRLLARESFYGDDVLRQSTVCGDKKRGLLKLDEVKMSQLLGTLHRHPSFCALSQEKFNALVHKKVVPSISHFCKELRKK